MFIAAWCIIVQKEATQMSTSFYMDNKTCKIQMEYYSAILKCWYMQWHGWTLNTVNLKEARFKRYRYISMKCPEKKNLLTETSYWLPGTGEGQGEEGTRFNCNQAWGILLGFWKCVYSWIVVVSAQFLKWVNFVALNFTSTFFYRTYMWILQNVNYTSIKNF